MSVLSALRRTSQHRSLLPRRFFSIPSSRPLALVVARHKLAPEAPNRFYFHYSNPIDWPLVLQDELGLPRTPKVLSVFSSFSGESDPGVTATFNVSYDKLMDTKAYFQEQERRYNELMAAFKKNGQVRDALSKVLNTEIVKLRKRIEASNTRADARDAEMAILLRDAKDLRERWAALEHGRDLDELGDFAVRYCEFKIALQPRAPTTSVGKKHKSKKSKKSSKHANGHSLVPTVRPSNEWVFRPYRYTKLCEIIAKLTPDDFPDQLDAKLVFQAGLEEFERFATEAQKRFSLL